MGKTVKKVEEAHRKNKKETTLENKCYKNVIIFKKGIAICKQVCYNTVTYKR